MPQPPATQPPTQQPANSPPPATAPQPQQPAGQQPVPTAQQPTAPASVPVVQTPKPIAFASDPNSDAPPISEDELRQQLQGKTFYLRGGYLDNSLHFDEHGALDGGSPQASYTLSLVEIDRVHLDKRHLELEGVRYGLHFLGALPTEDQSLAVDRVRLTSKKKPLRISIAREEVVKVKEEKRKGPVYLARPAPGAAAPGQPAGTATAPAPLEEERRGGTVTISQAHANRALQQAVDRVFAAGIDDRMISTLPQYWKLYYKSVAEQQTYRPSDPGVLHQSQVDQKAKLVSVFEPPSNEYAQKNGVAGMAMYHVVVGVDGRPKEIAVGRPIGFGLDENAVAAIRQALFQPARKDGKPVPVELDLVVNFRIFSKRTAMASNQPIQGTQSKAPILPGPYSVNLPKAPPATAGQPSDAGEPTAGQPAKQQPPAGAQPPATPPQPPTPQPAPAQPPSPQPQ
ncbi:MAG TPA: energy transducer TonB [Terracidiphilus sp.]|nr:energy transducer TonB [Terracidiphilus sp.]